MQGRVALHATQPSREDRASIPFVTLAQRFMLAAAVLVITTTTALALAVRTAWRNAEEAAFAARVASASLQIERDLALEAQRLPTLVQPLCEHDPVVDSTLVDLRTGRLDKGRRLSLSLRVPELMKALGLDELILVTGRGEVLGAGDTAQVGSRDAGLAARLREPRGPSKLRASPPPVAIETYCSQEDNGVLVGLYAARHLHRLLDQASRRVGLELSMDSSEPPEGSMSQPIRVREFGDLQITAAQSRMPLKATLRQLDATVLLLGLITLAGALVGAALMARGLARPIVRLAAEAERAVHAQPRPVLATGGRELQQLASSFNRAILELAAMRKRLAATERIAARREIAQQVAHEIKNPLAPIRAAVETLRRLHARNDQRFDEYFDEATRTVLDEVNRITTIVQGFTRFARLPAPQPVPCDVAALAQRVVGLHATTCAGLTLDSPPSLHLRADPDQLVQVLTNLVQNALDAASVSADPRVEVRLVPQGEKLRIEVADNGPGVAPEMEDRLFEPYATSKSHGTGLGLAIVQRIVVEHGGQIHHERPAAGGARFVIELPREAGLGGPRLPANHPEL